MSYLELAKMSVTEKSVKTDGDKPIPYEALEAIYRGALDRLNARAVKDPDWLDTVDFESSSYNQAYRRINEVWSACLEGKARLEEFKCTVTVWEKVCSNSNRQLFS